jgi:hypothetical protein
MFTKSLTRWKNAAKDTYPSKVRMAWFWQNQSADAECERFILQGTS